MEYKHTPIKLFRLRKVGDGYELIVDDRFFARLFARKVDENLRSIVSETIAQKTEASKNFAFFCGEVAFATWIFLSYTFFIFELWI